MRPHSFSFSMAAADADGIAAAQAVAGAGDLTLDGALASGGVATMDVARHLVIVSSNAGDTTQTATFTGLDRNGQAQTSTVTLNGTTSVPVPKNFASVSQVAISTACTGNISAGTLNAADTPWFPWSRSVDEAHISVNVSTGASLTYGAEHCYTDVLDQDFQEDEAVNVHTDGTMTGESASSEVRLEGAPRASRLNITGYTSGTLVTVYTQPRE